MTLWGPLMADNCPQREDIINALKLNQTILTNQENQEHFKFSSNGKMWKEIHFKFYDFYYNNHRGKFISQLHDPNWVIQTQEYEDGECSVRVYLASKRNFLLFYMNVRPVNKS